MLSLSASISGCSPAAAQKPDKPRKTLLIVDDEEGPRQSLRVVFKEDYNLLLASDGHKAVEFARQHPIDAAVLDIRMTGMSGIQVLEQLRAVQPRIEVIMLTAYETIDTIRQALRLGACDYLNKPFDIVTIRKAVASAMERRAVAEEIHKSNEKLASLQSDLRDQKLKEEVTRTRGEIYASVIHDINGPLTTISGFISLVDQSLTQSPRLEGNDLAFLKDALKSITGQVNNCMEMSQRYLSFMRQQASNETRVSVNTVLKDLQQLLRAHPSRKLHRLEIHPLTEDIQVSINGTDLIQILLNLCINGFQSSATPITVTVSSRVHFQPIELPVQDGPNDRVLNGDLLPKTGPVLELAVHDSGPGIAPDVMAKVFQTFFTTKPAGKGTGLGLSIVQRLLNEAKGTLHLHSQLNQGTTFRLYLPGNQS